MHKATIATAPNRDRPGLASHILLQAGDTPTNKLAVTWVEVDPGSSQQPHSHAPEQVYIIIRGNGLMRVGTETAEVQPGDLVHIPGNTVHTIENTGSEKLIYISASTPAFDLKALYDSGQLKDTML